MFLRDAERLQALLHGWRGVRVIRVFVSHAGEDIALAREVHRWVTESGHEAFLDQDLRDGMTVGEQWRHRLHERLRWADAVVCVVTSAYLASTWCTAEVAAAQFRGNRLLPLLAEPEVAHPLLAEVHYTDLTRDRAAARATLAEAMRRVDDAGGAGWADDRSPFPGLRPFDIDRHRVFFGRAEEVKQLTELLRATAQGAALLVVGPSGCGKSSLVRAGLTPVMADEPGWRTLSPILPGADPIGALASRCPPRGNPSARRHRHRRGRTPWGLTGMLHGGGWRCDIHQGCPYPDRGDPRESGVRRFTRSDRSDLPSLRDCGTQRVRLSRTGEDRPDSDVDLLYMSVSDSTISLWELWELRDELAQLLGRKVDLVPKGNLHWVIRDRVLAEARPVYAA